MKNVADSYTHRIWNLHDLKAIDELLDPNIVFHSLLGDFHGKDAMRKVVDTWLTGFPDLSIENINVVTEGEFTAINWNAQGTHQGEFKGHAASGKKVKYAGATFYRVKEGKIIEYWAYVNLHHLFAQIT